MIDNGKEMTSFFAYLPIYKFKELMKYFVGIDWSICSPAICVCKNEFNLENCEFYFFRSTKAQRKINVKGLNHYEKMEFESDMQRYEQLSDWAISHIPPASKIAMEGYSYSSKGLIFNLAEASGILKYRLHLMGYSISIIPPTMIKKAGSGKGNANKYKMQEAFEKENGNFLDCLGKSSSPRSDIIDSYYIAKMCANI